MKNYIAENLTDFLPNSFLHVNSCGFLQPTAYPYGILRENGRSDYQMLYVQSGYIEVEIDGRLKKLNAGECMIYYPRVKQYYIFSPEGNSRNYWMHFTGFSLEEILLSANITKSTILPVHSCMQFERLFHQLLRVYTLKKSMHEQEEKCLLLQLLTLLSKDASPDGSTGYDDIYSIAGYICEHYNEPADLDSYAAMAHLSRSRFCHLFAELIGYSPYHYLQRIRMDKARELLLLSSLQVSEIAANIGLTDPLYFSRIFKKYYGLSPQKFRQTGGSCKA